MQKVIIGVLLIIIVFMFFSGLLFFYEARYIGSRASVVNSSFSPENSYVIVNPTKAKVNGVQKVRISVFVLNGQGLGVLGKAIQIPNPDAQNIVIDMLQSKTDAMGKAFADVSSKAPSAFYLDIKVDGEVLPQKAHLFFE